MYSIEHFLEKFSYDLEKQSKRALRFLAMYYPNAEIRRKCWIMTNVILGDNTYLNPNITVLDDYQGTNSLLSIGNNCSIASGVVFAPYSKHNNSNILREMGLLEKYEKVEKIEIGDDVWIGANCTILAGVRIGSCCIIGANSLINKNIPDFTLSYGSPIRIIKDLRQ
jgi:maltose O-acetyltransferase